MPKIHGGDVFAAASELGVAPAEILDFSASINPLGSPPAALQAATAALQECGHYPEITASSLRSDLAGFHTLPPECLLPGAGSTELLYLLPRVLRPRRAVLVEPAFSEYRRALEQVGCPVEPFLPPPGKLLDIDRLTPSLRGDTDLLILANPANPSGQILTREQIVDLVGRCRGRCQLVIDEAFVDFAPEHSVIDQVATEKHLWILRSMTKFYAIPGLRVGYLAGPLGGMERIAAAKEPWTLSTPAIAAARACLREREFRERTLVEVAELRAGLGRQLESLGCTVFPSVVNYLLVRLPQNMPSAGDVTASLRRQGVLVRDCGNFAGLDQNFLRVAVRGAAENARLVAVLREAGVVKSD